MGKVKTKVMTYALYENLFFLNESDIDCLINNKIKDFDPVESISFSSFLNMLCQTTPIEDLLRLQIGGKGSLFERRDMVGLFLEPRIIYHRDNLLHYIIRIIAQKVNGKNRITGTNKGFDENVYNYGQALLLINNKINYLKPQNFEREFIRSFPYHVPNALFWFYKHRIIRYSYIYEQILPHKIKDSEKKLLLSGIELIEKIYSVKFNDYINTIKGLFVWFLAAKEKGINSPHFDMDNIVTFYINKRKFPGTKFLPTIEALSKDIGGFYEEFNKTRKDKIDNAVFCHFPRVFDYPIFKINNAKFCILDIKFLIEGICSGLVWKIDSIIRNNNKLNYSIQNIREEYGYLLEEYFAFLIKNIFPDIQLKYKQNGEPDAVLEANVNGESFIIIFEFTTKFYRISSLYNRTSRNFIEDLNRVLFRDIKKDKGKFVNLDRYAAKYKKKSKTLILILITENWLGDYDLLDRIDNILSRKIREYRLDNLHRCKPIILSLDDLETFWAIASRGKEKAEFINSLRLWEREQKGNYWFSYANFVSTGRRLINEGYFKFFSTANLGK